MNLKGGLNIVKRDVYPSFGQVTVGSMFNDAMNELSLASGHMMAITGY